MITLFSFGANFGLPDASPFATKVETLLRMSRLPFQKAPMSLSKAPKGKVPYISDGCKLLGDSTFIRWHLENNYGIDFDQGLTAEQRAIAWAFEKMAEDHLYWASLHTRWIDDANFKRGPANFFKTAPAAIRPMVAALIRRRIRKALYLQGTGRHSPAEIAALGTRAIGAIADFLAEKPFFMGAEPSGADATIFAFVISSLCPLFESPLQQAASNHPNLRRYVGRMTARFYPDLTEVAGCKAQA